MYKGYKNLLFSLFFYLDFYENLINYYNLYSFHSLDIFFVLYNMEDIKLEHQKNFIIKEK
jgi:hypothetical protein